MTEGSILIVGRNGQLATCLRDLAAIRGIRAIALGRRDLDLETPGRASEVIASIAPSVMINTAAYTAVDQAEAETAKAFKINRDGAAALADVAWQMHIPFVHLSTDYVFDGRKPDTYDETDIPAPLNVYGASKLAGEAAVLAVHPLATVVRSSWIYSAYGTNFVRTMLRLSRTRPVIRVVCDQQGNPTSASDLAEALLGIAERSLVEDRRTMAGIFHLTGQGGTTWHGFAEAVLDGLSRREVQIPRLEAVSTGEYPTVACRPANSRLDSSKAERVFGIRLASWRQSLEICLDQLVGGEADLAGKSGGWRERDAALSDHPRGQQAVVASL